MWNVSRWMFKNMHTDTSQEIMHIYIFMFHDNYILKYKSNFMYLIILVWFLSQKCHFSSNIGKYWKMKPSLLMLGNMSFSFTASSFSLLLMPRLPPKKSLIFSTVYHLNWGPFLYYKPVAFSSMKMMVYLMLLLLLLTCLTCCFSITSMSKTFYGAGVSWLRVCPKDSWT